MLIKIQKQARRSVSATLNALFEDMAHHRNAYLVFGRFSSESVELTLLPYSRGKSTCYSDNT